MKRIDDMLERLKGQIPEVSDADALTDSIMAAIEETEDRKPVTVPMWLSVLRTVSSVAAVVLMVLFVQLKSEITFQEENAETVYLEVVSEECEDCSPAERYNMRIEKMRLMNRRKVLKERYYANSDF
jgi:hypothetical protein